MNEPDIDAFAAARRRVLLEEELSSGFTVYQERAVHKTVKLYIDPDNTHHEVEVFGSVADVLNEHGVFEVQTGSFLPLVPKITKLLREYPVTLVHPFARHTAHKWLDPETGEIITPKRRGASAPIHPIAYELMKLGDIILHPGFTFRLLLLDYEEFRKLDGWDRSRKRGSTLIEKIPTAISEDIAFRKREDYLLFMPSGLGDTFTAREYMKCAGCASRYGVYGLKLLLRLGFVEELGRSGRAVLYGRVK